MMKLKDWNESISYGNGICNELKDEGYNVKLKSYTMYDGRKGLYIQVFDQYGNLFKEYASGIVDNIDEMKKNLRINANRIRKEV